MKFKRLPLNDKVSFKIKKSFGIVNYLFKIFAIKG